MVTNIKHSVIFSTRLPKVRKMEELLIEKFTIQELLHRLPPTYKAVHQARYEV
jgi:hypothetical protein